MHCKNDSLAVSEIMIKTETVDNKAPSLVYWIPILMCWEMEIHYNICINTFTFCQFTFFHNMLNDLELLIVERNQLFDYKTLFAIVCFSIKILCGIWLLTHPMVFLLWMVSYSAVNVPVIDYFSATIDTTNW